MVESGVTAIQISVIYKNASNMFDSMHMDAETEKQFKHKL